MLIFYWYPKCSTCKKAKAWLDEKGISYQMIDMVETPPSVELLTTWMDHSDLPIRRFFNTSGIKYREQGLKNKVNDFSIEEAAIRLSADGLLIKRPILVKGNQVVLGFKEETYTSFVEGEY